MSIKLLHTRVLKLSQKEYEHIMFIRNEMPFGNCRLFTHNAEPAKIDDIKKEKIYGIKSGLDFSQEEKAGNSS